MSKVFKAIGTISGLVSTVFAVTGNPVLATAFGAVAAPAAKCGSIPTRPSK